jgi:DNA-binding MarR family transcriptional regulator
MASAGLIPFITPRPRIANPQTALIIEPGIVDRLEEAGYVRRANDPKDRRRTIVEPVRNNKLERKLEAIFTPFHEKMYDLLSSYSDSELAFLLDVMTKSIELTREESRKLRNQKG